MSRLTKRIAIYASSAQVGAEYAQTVCRTLAQELTGWGCDTDVGLMLLANLDLPYAAAADDPAPLTGPAAFYSGGEFNMQVQADALVFLPHVDWLEIAADAGGGLLPVESRLGRVVVRLARDAGPRGRKVPVLVLLLPTPPSVRAELPRRAREVAAEEREWKLKVSAPRRRELRHAALRASPRAADVEALVAALSPAGSPALSEDEREYVRKILPELGARALARRRELHPAESDEESVRALPRVLQELVPPPVHRHLERVADLELIRAHTKRRREMHATLAQQCARGGEARSAFRAERHRVERAFRQGPKVKLRLVDLCGEMVETWTRRSTAESLAPVSRTLMAAVCSHGERRPRTREAHAAEHASGSPRDLRKSEEPQRNRQSDG